MPRDATTGRMTASHGHTAGGTLSPEYVTWYGMLARCNTPSAGNYRLYGGRGIAVCERWHKFEAFLADMGPRGAGMSIDRIDVNGNYEPANCRWATRSEQARNRRVNRLVEVRGVTKTMIEWSQTCGVGVSTICQRLRMGWAPEDAVSFRSIGRSLGLSHKAVSAFIQKTRNKEAA